MAALLPQFGRNLCSNGTGKTTQAQALRGQGVKARYLHNRFGPTFTYPFLWLGKSLFLRGRDRSADYRGYAAAKGKVVRWPLLSRAYPYLLLLDYSWPIKVRLALGGRGAEVVVCDRYLHDTVVDVAVDMGWPSSRVVKAVEGLMRFLPQPRLLFLMDAPEEVAFARKQDIPSPDFLRARRQLYLEVGQHYQMVMLNGSASPEALGAEVWDRVKGL